MYPIGVVEVLGLGLFFWLLVLSIFFWKERNFLYKLFPKSKGKIAQDQGYLLLKDKFQQVLDSIEEFKSRDQVLVKKFRQLSKESFGHIQKVDIIRYNPFDDTGGNMSFSVVLLDGKLNGLILTSLHSRSGTRMYAKIIKEGSSEIELAKEEKEVLKRF